MKRQVNLRQIEAFKAVIEQGTVSRAAEILYISQPAVSKMLTHLEDDSGLTLFDRVRGKLAPTRQGMRLYGEIDRIFAGLRQLEQAIDSIRRDEQRHLTVGTLPALAGSFIRRVSLNFLKTHPDVTLAIHSRSSQIVTEWLVTRQLDLGLVNGLVDNTYIAREPLMEHALVCALPPSHPLCKKKVIRPRDLDNVPFVTFFFMSQTRQLVETVFEEHNVHLNVVLETDNAPSVCEFVASGLGVSLIHPLFGGGMQDRIVLRRFEPEVHFRFQLCRMPASQNSSLVEAFFHEVRQVADEVFHETLNA
ncbi:LysR substrate-binding domain-containing protein [Paraburkholderia kururiensis]|uniref:LysR substrate-binding domain-containing protein n=1 Tax=Paraburkholderia kururiensis TaxID=984307 RepID=UPI000F866F3B|nr:LysR substrate-binding domain-containing protein [Paraburkholderia kururiensis]